MITKALAFQTSDGQTHASLAAAQSHEMQILLESLVMTESTPNEDVANWIISNCDKLIDILTTKPTSKVRARKINGGTKKCMATAPASA